MNFFRRFCFCLLLSVSFSGWAQKVNKPVFTIVPLGVKGGIDESNLSAYMLAPQGSSSFICLDAGTLHAGIERAIEHHIFNVPVADVLKKNIKGYLISHGHLDHVAGLIINSPEDSTKNIYAMPYVLDVLKKNYFTWQSWANFANEGDKPAVGKYHYQMLETGKEVPLENTDMSVRAFPLSHVNPYQSTAFLIRHSDNYILYLGDTGADKLEKSDKLQLLWQQIAPLIKSQKLKGIFIEVSFPDEQPDKSLFGHLTPRLLMQEMDALSKLTGTNAIKYLPLLITHIKPFGKQEEHLKNQLNQENKLQLKLIFPEQGKMLEL